MASDARISVTFTAHPKTKKLIRRHGHAAGWGLVCLFLWAAANRHDGDLEGMTAEDIELAVDWMGEEGKLVHALKDVGFLDGDEGTYKIHDWAEHNPWAAGTSDRSEASKFAALCKRYGRERAAEMMPDYAPRMRTACEPDAPRTEAQCEPDAVDQKPQCPVTVSVSVSDTESKSRSRKRDEYSQEFLGLLKAYPKREGTNPLPRAWKAYNAALGRGATIEQLVAAAKAYGRTDVAGTKFCQQLATWLNGDEWKNQTVEPEQTEDPEILIWKLRVQNWKPGKYWNRDQWGPAPNEVGCRAPPCALESYQKAVA